MEAVCSAVLPVARRSPAVKSAEVVQIECRQHWGVLILPMLGLAVWLAAGVFFASILASIFGVVGHGQVTAAPQLILGMFGGSTFLIGWLCWHSYRKSAIRLTNRRAILQTGPLFKGAGEMDLGEAKLVTLREPLLGRLFNYGTVCIVGMRGARFPLRFIPNPREFYQTISQLVDE